MQSPRVELEGATSATPVPVQPALPHYWIADAEGETPLLPTDHPPWMRDAIAISQQARRWMERLRPLVVRVLGFWDHAVRAIRVAGRTVTVDPAGCYRVD